MGLIFASQVYGCSRAFRIGKVYTYQPSGTIDENEISCDPSEMFKKLTWSALSAPCLTLAVYEIYANGVKAFTSPSDWKER